MFGRTTGPRLFVNGEPTRWTGVGGGAGVDETGTYRFLEFERRGLLGKKGRMYHNKLPEETQVTALYGRGELLRVDLRTDDTYASRWTG